RTLVRMTWTKQRLLEWRTASDSERGADGNLEETYRSMAFAPALAAAALLVLVFYDLQKLHYAGPWIAAWIASPFIAWWLSRPIPRQELRFTDSQRHFLEKLSRKTWRYFEDFVTEEENWLPPDNVHQNPGLVVAPRTSPTNIGMALLADLAAYDFGYCSAARLLARTQPTLDTLARLDRYQGHFLNWYQTRTLAPLHPQYVSTVDSGNLAASLLVHSSGCLELSEARILPPRWSGGLRDTLRVLVDAARGTAGPLVSADMVRKIE